MQSKKMDWLERDTEFKYDRITTYFCIFSLLILFVIFSAAILITGYHYTEDLLVLFAGFIFFYIPLFLYVSIYNSIATRKKPYKKMF